jgi:hypothetical protein
VRRDRAAELAKRLADAFGAWDRINLSTITIYAEKMEPWDEDLAAEAVENLIDYSRRFPNVIDLREAYAAAGGDVPDPGRSMSPEVEHREPLSADERIAVDAMRKEFVAQVRQMTAERSLTPSQGSGTVGADDGQEQT